MHAAAVFWVEAISSWLVALRAAGRPETTIGLREYQLNRLAAAMAPRGPWEVSGEALVGWLGSQAWARDTRRSYRSAIRGFYTWATDRGYCDGNPALEIPPVRPTEPAPHPAPEDAYRVALAGADARTRLMLRLAAELGLRRGEVARVHADDLIRDLSGWSLRVHGKGGRERVVPLTDSMAALVRRHAARGYLFPGSDDGHLSPRWVGKLVSRSLPEAWAMHSLRHRFATRAYAADHDVFTVQSLLGHASPVTTVRYVAIDDARRRAVIRAVSRLNRCGSGCG